MNGERRWRSAGHAALASGLSAWAYSAFVMNAGLEDTIAVMTLAYVGAFVVVAAVLRRK